MDAQGSEASLFEKARQQAGEIVSAYSNDDRFQLLTNDFEGRQQRLLTEEEALAYLDELEVGPSSRRLSEVFERQKQALTNASTPEQHVFLLSDFQESINDFKNDTAYKVYFMPLGGRAAKCVCRFGLV